MRVGLLILASAIQMLGSAQSDTTWHSPSRLSIRVQFAGQQGLLSAGLLTDLGKDRIQLGLMYGFAPGILNTADFHGVTVRSTWGLKDYPISKNGKLSTTAYAAVSGMLEVGNISFLFLPDNFPERYYFPQAFHAILGGGLKVKKKGEGMPWVFTMEAITLDTHLWYLISQRQVGFEDAWSLSIGFEVKPFGRKPK
jgi:hypothetical protein